MIEAKLISIASTSSGGEGGLRGHKLSRKVFVVISHACEGLALYHFVVLESDHTSIPMFWFPDLSLSHL
jgi:hypothetical protein